MNMYSPCLECLFKQRYQYGLIYCTHQNTDSMRVEVKVDEKHWPNMYDQYNIIECREGRYSIKKD
jgi:hypothetical protein